MVHVLRNFYGIPAGQYAGQPTLICDSHVGAVVMPAGLGSRVLAALTATRQPTSAIADPRDRRWWFLAERTTEPVEGSEIIPPVDCRVKLLTTGSQVFLPKTDCAAGWHWACPPAPGGLQLPTDVAIFAAVGLLLADTTIPTR